MKDDILCTCREVRRSTIQQAIEGGADLDQLRRTFGCAVTCGSCLPDIKRMLGAEQKRWWRSLVRPGAFAAVAVASLALIPALERFLAVGPANTGHEDLDCVSCHDPARGTMRQQLQANARWALGQRETPADFVHAPVGNSVCNDCHDREGEDRHPSFRFKEARFDEAREAIAPQLCVSCHMEHLGGRVTVEGDYCTHCHQEFEIDEDIIEPKHQALADEERFDTCLQCHDFHGNHRMEEPEDLDGAWSIDEVRAYLDGGEDPYGEDLRFGNLEERPE